MSVTRAEDRPGRSHVPPTPPADRKGQTDG